jgi:signal transduction histidine kinase
VREQFRVTTWTIGALVVSIFAIAAATAWTVSQQFALRETPEHRGSHGGHELRTPLASMRLLVETLLAGRYRSDEQLQEYLGLIATENQRLSRLTENFLTFARLDSRKDLLAQERVVAAEVAEQVVELLGSRLHAEGCAFTCEIQRTCRRSAAIAMP